MKYLKALMAKVTRNMSYYEWIHWLKFCTNLYGFVFCCRTRWREDCCHGQVKRRASYQRQDQKQRTGMFGFFCNSETVPCSFLIKCWSNVLLYCLWPRAPKAATARPPAKKGKTFCPLTRSKSRERESDRGRGNGRSERWRGVDTLGKFYFIITS